ncbi:hypothetical protein DQ384_22470 [Sphaerisporangium album]|uniref:Uncharacterized protein n=1 Tax=Sphaerisporangium album TaxID=509200 RepID=A0A367FFD2_9ACTN|nr:hypothetical protein [Sphaerisporangium album]RCG29103.1 hypothetical protein DQ384_22470 [Sphaerisporangium album]
MSDQLESRLRRTLASQAERIPGDPDPYPAVARRIGRARRNRRAALAAALVAVVALGAGVPAGLRARDRTDIAAVESPSLLDWPTRGSLAGDARFLAGVRARLAGSNVHVLFAGDGGGRRLVLVAVGHDTAAYGWVLYGAAGTPADRLEQEEVFGPSSLGRERAPIVWFGPEQGNVLLVVGPPRMTAVKVLSSISYPADGTPVPRPRVVPADHGAVLLAVPDARPGRLFVKPRIGDMYLSATEPAWSLDSTADPAFWDRVDKDAASARVVAADARGLMHGLGAIATPPERLTYRFLWGGSLGHRRTALVATFSGPDTPTFLVIQTTYTHPDGSTEQDRLGRALWDPEEAKAPVGWTTVTGEKSNDDSAPATAAVYVPGRPGTRVELWDGETRFAAGTTGPEGVAVFPTGVPRSRLRTFEYHVFSDAGTVFHRAELGLGDLSTAVVGPRDW